MKGRMFSGANIKTKVSESFDRGKILLAVVGGFFMPGGLMPFLRNANRERFTVVDNCAIRDRRLSLKAIGLLVCLLSLPDDWEFSEKGLESQFEQDGQTSIRSGLAELERYGYLKRERLRDRAGRILRVEWVLSETHEFENPHLENPNMDNPSLENRPQLNTNRENTYKQKDLIDAPLPPVAKPKTESNENGSGNMVSENRGEEMAPYSPEDGLAYPETADEVVKEAENQGCNMTAQEAKDFLDLNQARGWMIGCTRIRDWRRLVKSFMDRQRNAERRRMSMGRYQVPKLDRTHYSVNL